VNPVRRFIHKDPLFGLEDGAAELHSRLSGLLREEWRPLSLTALLSQFSVFAVKLAAMRLTGAPDEAVSVAEALAVFASVRLASPVPIIPGNAGLSELGYIG